MVFSQERERERGNNQRDAEHTRKSPVSLVNPRVPYYILYTCLVCPYLVSRVVWKCAIGELHKWRQAWLQSTLLAVTFLHSIRYMQSRTGGKVRVRCTHRRYRKQLRTADSYIRRDFVASLTLVSILLLLIIICWVL